MGKPVKLKSVDAASATEAGESTMSLGHYHVGLFVVARNLDESNDTLSVALEASPNDEEWAYAGDATSTKHVDTTDFTQDPTSGHMTASVSFAGSYYPYLRARVAEYDDAADGDLEVDAWVLAGAWPEAGVRGGRDNG